MHAQIMLSEEVPFLLHSPIKYLQLESYELKFKGERKKSPKSCIRGWIYFEMGTTSFLRCNTNRKVCANSVKPLVTYIPPGDAVSPHPLLFNTLGYASSPGRASVQPWLSTLGFHRTNGPAASSQVSMGSWEAWSRESLLQPPALVSAGPPKPCETSAPHSEQAVLQMRVTWDPRGGPSSSAQPRSILFILAKFCVPGYQK